MRLSCVIIYSPLHYNTVFLEVGGAMQFDRHPEINEGTKAFARWVFDHHSRPLGVGGRFQDSAHAELAGGDTLSKDEIKELVEFTRLYGIEVIPEIEVPLIGSKKELDIVKNVINTTAEEVFAEKGQKIEKRI